MPLLLPPDVTVTVTGTVCVALVPVPVTVIVYVPSAVLLATEIVSFELGLEVLVGVTLFGDKPSVMPVGCPLAVRLTFCDGPLVRATN